MRLALSLSVLLGLLAWPALGREPIVFDFETPDSPLNDVWAPSPLDGGPQSVKITTERARSGLRSLKLYGRLPDGFGVMYQPWQDWLGFSRLSFDLWLPPSVGRVRDSFDCWVYLKDSSYYWFQTPVFKDPRTLKRKVRLVGGQWMHFDLDISHTSKIWLPGGHKRSWDYATHRPREFGIRFFGTKPWEGAVYLDNITLSGNDPVAGKMPTGKVPGERAARPLKVSASAAAVPQYEKLELTFPADRLYENPFDPEVVDVEGHFLGPDGKTVTVPGFFYQSYVRSQSPGGFEQLTPVGKPCWKVRFAPKLAGPYTYWVTLQDASGRAESPHAKLTAKAPLKPQGYVRVSQKDPHYFEFENGEFFYPSGINMRDGGDDASKQKGSYDFDYYFRRFHEEGINFVRTWMCAWWGGIEWSEQYHSRFDGVGRYNLYNAWRLDYCVDLARKSDIYLEITFNSHGQLRRDKFDEEWTYSPWNVRNGGYVASPAMFFSSERVKRDFRNRYRYIIARWGYSRNIMSWDLWNEIDLSEGYDPALVAAWHRELGGYLKDLDPWKHIVGTHICLFWVPGLAAPLWESPQIEMVKSDAYWDQRDERLDMGMYASYLGKTNYNVDCAPIYDKPFVFIEYGPLYAAVAGRQVTPELWRSRFRTGLWTSAVLPVACPGHFWYQQEWDQYKLYRYQKPVQKLFGHLDRRGHAYRLRAYAAPLWTIRLTGGQTLQAVGMADAGGGYMYVNDPPKMGYEDRAQVPNPTKGVNAAIFALNQGDYDVDFIDTLTGDVTSKVAGKVDHDGGSLRFSLPPVADDLLVRFTRKAAQ